MLLPQATGRDDEYHQYLVTITPNAGFVGKLVISVAQFEDMGKPVSKEYVPLLRSQRLDTTLDASAEGRSRLDRIMDGREVLTVEANAAADTNIAAATAAYEARDKVLAAVANEKILAAELVIPAGGYLVLGGTGINASSAKLAEKLTAASLLYNTTKDLALPFPADDLDNFFRNGGTLNLGYADIPAATGSGHDDSKATAAADHADNTGYAGATTNAYAAGAVIINEIMWGLDAGADNQPVYRTA